MLSISATRRLFSLFYGGVIVLLLLLPLGFSKGNAGGEILRIPLLKSEAVGSVTTMQHFIDRHHRINARIAALRALDEDSIAAAASTLSIPLVDYWDSNWLGNITIGAFCHCLMKGQ